MSSNACVGCSFMPSPAFTTDARTFFASSAGVPAMEWRMTMMSVSSASSVRPVSMSDSPFLTDDVATEIEIVRAPRRRAAVSKEFLVRVLFS